MRLAANRRPSPRTLPSARAAEDLVAAALARQGWRILARNYRHIGFELDVVASKGRTTIIVEVKRRRHPPRTLAEGDMLIPWRKRLALKRGADAFIVRTQHRTETIRFDLAIVHGTTARPEIKYVVDIR